MSLIAELKRRNVFRVGVAYAIVAWLLIEVAHTAFSALQLPDFRKCTGHQAEVVQAFDATEPKAGALRGWRPR